VQGGWWRDAGPVATPTTSAPEPSPRPTPPPGSWPAVYAEDPFYCGMPVPEIFDPAGDAELHLEPTIGRVRVAEDDTLLIPSTVDPLDGAVLGQGDWWELDAVLVNGSGQVLDGALPGHHEPQLLVVVDGDVAGTLSYSVTMDARSPVPLTMRPDDRASSSIFGVIAMCGRSWPDVRVLPGGEYEVYVTQDVYAAALPAGADPLGASLDASRWVTLVGGPYTVTLTDGVAPDQFDEKYATEPPGPDRVWISPAGLVRNAGPMALPIGWELPEELPSNSLITWDPAACEGTDAPGRWRSVWADPPPDDAFQGVSFIPHVVDGRLTRLDFLTGMTTYGLRIGSAGSDSVHEGYAGVTLVHSAADWGVDAWALPAADGSTMIFEVMTDAALEAAGDTTTAQTPFDDDRVVAIVLLAPGQTYDYPAWGTDLCG